MLMSYSTCSDTPLVSFMVNRREHDLRCIGEHVPNITNITIFYDNGDIAGVVLSPMLDINAVFFYGKQIK